MLLSMQLQSQTSAKEHAALLSFLLGAAVVGYAAASVCVSSL